MKDLYLPLGYGAFQDPSEGKAGQDTHGPACLRLAEVVLCPGPPVFIARKPWHLAVPFSVRLADLWEVAGVTSASELSTS